MKNKFRSFGFWSALAGAVVVLLNALGRAFGFAIQEELVTDIIMAVAGVLVVLGVVTMPKGEENKTAQNDETNSQNDEQKSDIGETEEDKSNPNF